MPTFEVHVNDPLTHGDFNNQLDLTGTPDVVNLTYGINALIGQNGVFTFGVVTPVTGPRPFSYELVALINWRFGRIAWPACAAADGGRLSRAAGRCASGPPGTSAAGCDSAGGATRTPDRSSMSGRAAGAVHRDRPPRPVDRPR